MKPTAVVEEIVDALHDLSDPERQEWSVTYFPTSMRVIGCTNPDIKEVIRGLKDTHRQLSEKEWIALCVALVQTDIFECQGMAYELIGKNKNVWTVLTMKDIKALKKNLDNWASVDGFAVYVTGVQWRLGTVRDAWIHNLLASENRWERRLAVVSTVALNLKSRGGTGDAPRTMAVCERVVDDRDDMVVKALSWALRELSKRDKALVSEFMDRHRSRLAGRVLREVGHKLEFGTKN